jgi:chromosome segregation ATPase
MNQPTEDRIKRLEEEQRQLKEKVRKLEEQQTEPIRIDRLEIDRGGTHKRLDEIEENTNITKIQMEGARADIRVVKANQGDIQGYLENHSQRLESIEQKQDDHSELLGQLITVGEKSEATQDEHTKRFDKLESLMMQILDRLPPKAEGE